MYFGNNAIQVFDSRNAKSVSRKEWLAALFIKILLAVIIWSTVHKGSS